jgi:hypothetical protein
MSPEDVRLDPAGTDEFSVADQSLWKGERRPDEAARTREARDDAVPDLVR